MLTTTKNDLTYIEGVFLSVPILIQGMDREQARDALKSEMKRIWELRGYAVPSGWELDNEAVVIV